MRTKLPLPVVYAAALSKNEKTGPVVTTEVGTEKTCVDCALKENGCYFRTGRFMRIHDRKLNAGAKALSLRKIAQAEADAIDALSGRGARNRPIRLHVGGDCPTNTSAKIVSAACDRWTKRTGGPVWSYTHAWRRVKKDSWGGVSILASMETTKLGRRAIERGYAPSVVVPKFETSKAFKRDGITWIPCPAQVRSDMTCVDCRLCFDADALRDRNTGIAFEAHGSSRAKARSVCT
jgi:hypothetical protein